MRNATAKFSAAFVSLLLLAACRLPTAGLEPTVPMSWLSGNDAGPGNDDGAELTPQAAAKLGAAFDRIADVHQEVLEGLNPASSQAPVSAPAGSCPQRWHLGGYMTSFAVSVNGILGSLVGSGTSACEIHWLPRGERPESADLNGAAAIRIRESSTPQQLERQVEPVIQGALGSGLIRDETKFRANIQDSARNFQAVARTLGSLNLQGTKWAPDTFRLEVQFDANGNVLPLLEVGAGVLIRFDWERTKSGSAPASAPAGLAGSAADRLADRVRAFVMAVTEDLDVLDSDSSVIEGHGLKLKEIRIGAGFTVQGDVGIAEATTQITGSFEFHPQKVSPAKNSALSTLPDTLDMFTSGDPLAKNALSRTLVRIKRSTFRRGLARANRMAAFFAARAARMHIGRWGVSELNTEFDMSLAGTIGIATVGGTGVVELSYGNPAF